MQGKDNQSPFLEEMSIKKICGLICKTTKSSLVCTLYSSNMQIYTPSQGHQKSHATAASAKSRILPSKLSPNVDKTLKI